MILLESIYGPMQLDSVIMVTVILALTAHVLNLLVLHHHLLPMITTIVNLMQQLEAQVLKLMTLCGMVKTVPVGIIVALSPACHGSIVRYQ